MSWHILGIGVATWSTSCPSAQVAQHMLRALRQLLPMWAFTSMFRLILAIGFLPPPILCNISSQNPDLSDNKKHLLMLPVLTGTAPLANENWCDWGRFTSPTDATALSWSVFSFWYNFLTVLEPGKVHGEFYHGVRWSLVCWFLSLFICKLGSGFLPGASCLLMNMEDAALDASGWFVPAPG